MLTSFTRDVGARLMQCYLCGMERLFAVMDHSGRSRHLKDLSLFKETSAQHLARVHSDPVDTQARLDRVDELTRTHPTFRLINGD